jgi:hypothetical protein
MSRDPVAALPMRGMPTRQDSAALREAPGAASTRFPSRQNSPFRAASPRDFGSQTAFSVLMRTPTLSLRALLPPPFDRQMAIDPEVLFEVVIKHMPWEKPEVAVCLVCIEKRKKKNKAPKKATRLCSPCGHLVLCDRCAATAAAAKAKQATQMCPICKTPIQTSALPRFAGTCVICMDALSDTVILPCGHQSTCYPCATKMWVEKRQCPLCQGRIVSFRHQFPIFSKGEKKVFGDEEEAVPLWKSSS